MAQVLSESDLDRIHPARHAFGRGFFLVNLLRIEHFLLELGGDFTFVGRQRKLRVGVYIPSGSNAATKRAT